MVRIHDAGENSWALGPFCLVHLGGHRKTYPTFLPDAVHINTNLLFPLSPKKGKKRYPYLGELWNSAFMVCQLPCSNFHYFHYQYQRRMPWNHFHSGHSWYSQVVLLILSSIILKGSDFFIFFHVLWFCPTLHLRLIGKLWFIHLIHQVLPFPFWERWAIYCCLLVWPLKLENAVDTVQISLQNNNRYKQLYIFTNLNR